MIITLAFSNVVIDGLERRERLNFLWLRWTMFLQNILHSEGPSRAVSLDWVIHEPALRLELQVIMPWLILYAILLAERMADLAAEDCDAS